jgi:hypothetical protein
VVGVVAGQVLAGVLHRLQLVAGLDQFDEFWIRI